MSSRPTVSSSPSHASTSNPDLNRQMSVPYFNETGPIYKKEHVQGNEFVKFVRSHVAVVADNSPHGSTNPEKKAVWFDWKAFRTALASFQASDISAEHDLTATVPSYAGANTVSSTPTITAKKGGDIADTTIQVVLDALVARFASAFTDVLFLPASGIGGNKDPQTHFFNALRKNLYHAFTHHLQVSDAPERYLSFHRYANLDAGGRRRSAWEYRLLFVHSDVQLKTVRGLVMTVTLEGSFGDEHGGKDEEEPWYDVSLDSRGPFSGSLRATQMVVGEGFRCP